MLFIVDTISFLEKQWTINLLFSFWVVMSGRIVTDLPKIECS